MAAWHATRSRIASITHQARAQGHDPDPELLASLRQRLRAERAEEYVRGLLAGQPALNEDQRTHLAGLLLAAPGGDGGAT